MAITNASRLADFGSGIGTAGAVLQIDNSSKEVGIGTTNPNATLTVGNIGASGTSIYVHGDGRITGVITATTFSGNATGLAAGADISPGSISVTDTTASTSSSTGALIVSGGVGIAKSLFVGEGVSIAGTITYDDVTNIDSVGIVTAGKGLRATTGGLIVTAGVSTLSGGVDVSTTKPITLGTGTTIHQSASNSLVLGTNNKERVRIDSVGRIRIGTRATDNFGSNYNALQVHSESGANTYLALTNSTTGSNAVTAGFSLISVGVDAYVNNRSAGSITLSTTDTERVRIDKSGNVNMTGVCTATSFAGDGSSLTGTVNTGKAIAMAMIFG
jgi:hypothetical protein